MSRSFDPPSATMTEDQEARWLKRVLVKPADAVCPTGCPKAAHEPGVGVRDCVCWWLEPCRACDSIIEIDRLGAELLPWTQA